MCFCTNACRNLTVTVNQQYNLLTQTQNKTGSIRITVILWLGCVTIVDVEKLYKIWVCVYRII